MIVIIEILSAVALPKFVDLTANAQTAALQGTVGAFSAAANIVHAGWMAGGGTAAVDTVTLEGTTVVGVTDTGWPENDKASPPDNVVTAAECMMIWDLILTNPPSVATTAGSDYLASVTLSPTWIFTQTATTGRRIDYNANTGAVTIVVP